MVKILRLDAYFIEWIISTSLNGDKKSLGVLESFNPRVILNMWKSLNDNLFISFI